MPSRLDLDIRISAIFISLLLSLWAVYFSETINNDGIVYVATAGRIMQGDWNGAYQLYDWPVYSWLIALISKGSGISLETSAQLLDAAFLAALAFTFLTLVRDFGADRKTLLIAAFVILSHPYINDSREEIIRDHGYWALYLASVLFLFRYYRNPGWKFAVAWGIAITAATLFRIEGLVFLILMPMVFLVTPRRQAVPRATLFLQANTVLLILGALLLALSLLQTDFFASWAGRLHEPGNRLNMLWSGLAADLHQKADVVRYNVLTPWSDDYALPVIYAALIIIIADKIIRTLTPLYCLLPFVTKLRARFNPPAGSVVILVWLVTLNISVVSVFLIKEFFISSRYIVPLVLTVLTMTPFVLASLHDQWITRRNLSPAWRGAFPVILVVLIFMAGDGVITTKGSHRIYLRQAGEWIQENIPADAGLFTNNQMVRYYSGRPILERDPTNKKSNFDWLLGSAWKRSPYLAIDINRHAPPEDVKRVESLRARVLKSFRNARNERVLILEMDRGNRDMPAPSQ